MSEPQTMANEREWYESLGDGEYAFLVRADGERVGVAEPHAFVDGEYVDLYEYGLLAGEWDGREVA